MSPEELAEVDTDDTQYQITLMEEKNHKLSPNMAAIQDYKRKVGLPWDARILASSWKA